MDGKMKFFIMTLEFKIKLSICNPGITSEKCLILGTKNVVYTTNPVPLTERLKKITRQNFMLTLSRRLEISVTGKLTAAKTIKPSFLFSVLGGVYSPLMIICSCSNTCFTADSNGTWMDINYEEIN